MPWLSVGRMVGSAASADKAFRIKRLARRLVSIAQFACDQSDFRVAGQMLHVAEPLMWDASLTLKDQRDLASLVIGAHQRLWQARDRYSIELPGLDQFW